MQKKNPNVKTHQKEFSRHFTRHNSFPWHSLIFLRLFYFHELGKHTLRSLLFLSSLDPLPLHIQRLKHRVSTSPSLSIKKGKREEKHFQFLASKSRTSAKYQMYRDNRVYRKDKCMDYQQEISICQCKINLTSRPKKNFISLKKFLHSFVSSSSSSSPAASSTRCIRAPGSL